MKTSKDWQRGFEWATTELRNGKRVDEVEALADGAIDFNDFDRGALEAVREWGASHAH